MLRIEQPSNIKPDSWYQELYTGMLNLGSITPEDIEYIKAEIDPGFLKRIDCGEEERAYIHYEDGEFYERFNTIEKNREILNKIVGLWPKLLFERRYGGLYCIFLFLIKKCVDIFPNYLVTNHLSFLLDTIPEFFVTKDEKEIRYDDCEHYNIIFEEPISPKIERIPDWLYFFDFSFIEAQIFELIKKNEKWHDIDRDITIYRERKKGKYLQELADNFGIKFNSVSMVITKVRGAVNFFKGKLFEDFIYKKLQQSGLFEKVVKEAGKGEADVLAYTKDNQELYIYSLKNIRIDRKPYWLTKEELKPELERAVLQSLDYKVHLILLVFGNLHNVVKQFEIDYNNPKSIDISK